MKFINRAVGWLQLWNFGMPRCPPIAFFALPLAAGMSGGRQASFSLAATLNLP